MKVDGGEGGGAGLFKIVYSQFALMKIIRLKDGEMFHFLSVRFVEM